MIIIILYVHQFIEIIIKKNTFLANKVNHTLYKKSVLMEEVFTLKISFFQLFT